jgi:hypothetical protein
MQIMAQACICRFSKSFARNAEAFLPEIVCVNWFEIKQKSPKEVVWTLVNYAPARKKDCSA